MAELIHWEKNIFRKSSVWSFADEVKVTEGQTEKVLELH